MKKISEWKLGLLIGITWSLLSIALVAVAYFSDLKLALLELDLRLPTTLVLLIAWMLNLQEHFSFIVRAAEHGFTFNSLNIVISVTVGFVDGFTDGVLMGWIFNSLQNLRKSLIGFSVLNFGISVGVVFGFSSLLLALVAYIYDYGPVSYGYNYRPLSIIFMIADRLINPGDFGILLRQSYLSFPKTYHGILGWFCWGFADGFIIGLLAAYLYKFYKKYIPF